MTRTQLYLPQSQYEELKSIALLRRQTFASVVRELIEEKLTEMKKVRKNKNPKNNISRWLSSLKKIEKYKEKDGIRDGSVNHDKYLYGEFMKNA